MSREINQEKEIVKQAVAVQIVTENEAPTAEEVITAIRDTETLLLGKGYPGPVYFRFNEHIRRGETGFQAYVNRLETDKEQADRIAWAEEDKNYRYQNYLDLRAEFEPNRS